MRSNLPMPEKDRTDSGISFAIDIGGSKLMTAFIDASGAVTARTHHALEGASEEELLRLIEGDFAARPASVDLGNIRSVGIAVPGLTDPTRGLWLHASFSGIRNFPIAEILRERLHLPVYIENDVNACAVAERVFGVCREANDYVWLTISNGIGGALFIRGRLYRGAFLHAGEIGHMNVEPEGHPCGCGAKGCLEEYASGRALTRLYAARAGLPEAEAPSARDLAGLAREGGTAALATFREAALYLARGIANVVNLLNPEAVILGGGVARAFDIFGEDLRAEVATRIYREANPSIRIEPTALGYEAALLGAAAITRETVRKSFL